MPARSTARSLIYSAAVARATRIIAVSNAEYDAVYLYDASWKVLGVLRDFNIPTGLASDIKGDLYVADMLNSRIQVYPPSFKGRPTSLNDPGQYPQSVASFSNGKVVAAVNANSITIYTNGVAGAPIASPLTSRLYFAAFDGHGNLYLDGSGANNGPAFLGEIVDATNGGTTIAKLTVSKPYPGFAPYGIHVTNKGQIAILDQGGSTTAIYTYDPPSGGSLGYPVTTTSIPAAAQSFSFAFTRDMKALYAVENPLGLVNEFAYPKGGLPRSSLNFGGQPCCVAVLPTQYPGER